MLRAKRLRVSAPRLRPHYQSGLSYIEVLIATVLIAVSLVPAVEALRSGIFGAGLHEAATVDHYELEAKMEEVLSQPYALLDAAASAAGSETVPTSYSDSAGVSRRRLVYLSRYDPGVPGYTATDTGLLWVRVEFESRTGRLETLTVR